MNNLNQEITDIFDAVIDNNLSKICELIANGVNINQKHSHTRLTPLIQAINLLHIEVIKLLIEVGADVHLYQYIQTTPLGLSTSLGNLEIVKLLLQAGANPDLGGIDEPPLHRAVLIERVDIIKTLIEAGANINHLNSSNFTPLMVAANNGKFEIVKFLVETRRVYINATNQEGETALDKAIYWGYQEIIDYLHPLTNLELRQED
ncbi:MAG: ankyrin repeat domain-containing protein [Nostoc sp.]|uniref:ankyrin repeat domain-containing protein n=1 Tax=Nostoc sp. TaxID=1180 RepID=UPI002FF9354D